MKTDGFSLISSLKLRNGKDSGFRQFSDITRQKLLEILAGHPPEKIGHFIFWLEFLCSRMLAAFNDGSGLRFKMQSKTDHRIEAKTTIKKLSETRRLLRRIIALKMLPTGPQSLSDITFTAQELAEDSIYKTNCEAVGAAERALGDLEIIEAAFSDSIKHARRGTPKKVNRDFARQIANAYQKHFAHPPGYGADDDFPEVLSVVFEAVGIRIDEPQRLAKTILSE